MAFCVLTDNTMYAVAPSARVFRFLQHVQDVPWIPFLSGVLLLCFLLVSFVNLSVVDHQSSEDLPVQFSVLAGDEIKASLFGIIDKLKAVPPQTMLRTHLNEEPYWVFAELSGSVLFNNNQMYFRSRHLVQSSCWRMDDQGNLIQLNLKSNQGRLISADLHGEVDSRGVLCQFRFIGPASLEMGLQTSSSFAESTLNFERRQGFLEGVLYLMIGLVALAAMMTRNTLFVCYGFWLFASLRLVALSEGWDHHLFGMQLTSAILPHARMMAMAMYFASTLLMLIHLFENVRRESWLGVIRALQGTSIALMLLALFSSYSTFLELLWPMSLLGAFVVFWVVVQYFLERRDRVAIYYMAAMIATLTGVVAEILAAWFDQTFLLQFFNSASVTVMASVMTAVALAEFLRNAHRQQQLAAQQIEVAHERLESVFDIAPSSMFTCTNRGELLTYNKQFEDCFLSRTGQPTLDFLQPQHLNALFNLLEQPGRSSRRELPVVVGQGQTRWFELVVSRDQYQLVGVVSDFTIRKDRELALQYQATHDELTGALNRRGLQNCIHTILQKRAARFTFLCVEIKQFTKLIGAYGVSVSDHLLKAFFTELFRYMSTHGEVARLHVDQFVVLVNQNDALPAEETFNLFLERLAAAPFLLEGRSIQVSVLASIVVQGMLDNVLDVMDTVEVSMQESGSMAKRNACLDKVVLEQHQTGKLLEQSRTIRGLRDQKLPEGLTLAWQPILPLNTLHGPLYAEALLRIQAADGSLNSAEFLLEACERSGQTAFLDNWVLSQSLAFLTEHADQLESLSVLSINVSPGSLNDDMFLQDTLVLIRAHQPQASKLCLEITEVGSVINLQAVQQFIEQVRTLGVRIALDDFGAGYSNFRYAIDLHADVIKIDGSIIKNICHSTESYAVTAAIVRLAHDLGCKCVAEWVEDVHTLREVKELGVDYIQGYLISPAVPCSRFLNLNSPFELSQDSDHSRLFHEIVESAPC